MVGVMKWKYDQYSIDQRKQDCDFYGESSDMCKNEAWFMRELSQQLEEKFGVQRDLTLLVGRPYLTDLERCVLGGGA